MTKVAEPVGLKDIRGVDIVAHEGELFKRPGILAADTTLAIEPLGPQSEKLLQRPEQIELLNLKGECWTLHGRVIFGEIQMEKMGQAWKSPAVC